MRHTRQIGFVIALASFVMTGASASPRQQPALEPLSDPDAYAVYAAVLHRRWPRNANGQSFLQRETEPNVASGSRCLTRLEIEPGWREVVTNFFAVNAQGTKLLDTRLPWDGVYYLITREEIRADDARLALKYPGTWQHRPESIEYTAVSLVGFDADKTKAIVYTRTPGTDNVHWLVLVDGQWIYPKLSFGCSGGIA